MSAVIAWGDPPLSKGAGRWKPIVAELVGRPGEWALVVTGAPNASYAGSLRRHGCDVTARSTGDGYDIYARFIGEGVES